MLTYQQAIERDVCQVCEKPYTHGIYRKAVWQSQPGIPKAIGSGHPWCVSPATLLTSLLECDGHRLALLSAIRDHHGQKADDRCHEDDDKLYAAAGLPSCDRRVGDKAAMLVNCQRFIDRRCEGGGWPSYRELEAERTSLRHQLAHADALCSQLAGPDSCSLVAVAREYAAERERLEETVAELKKELASRQDDG